MKIVCLQYFLYLFLASFALDNDSNTTLEEDAAIQYFNQQKEQNINTTQFQISENWTSIAAHNITGKTFMLTSVNGTNSLRNDVNSSALVEHEEIDEVNESKPDVMLKSLHTQFLKNKEQAKKDEIQEECKRIRINSNVSKDNFLKQTGKKKKLPNNFYLRNGSKLELDDKKASKVRVYPSYFKEALKKIHQERNLSLTPNESLAEDNIHKISHKVIRNKKLKFYCPHVLLCKIQTIKSNIVQIYRTISEGMNGLILKEYWPLISLYISSITQFTASYFVTLTMLKISGCILKMFN